MTDDIIVHSIDLYTPHLQTLFLVEWRMILKVCVNRFLKPQTPDTGIKVTWLCDDSQCLSLQTNQSLQRSTLVLDIFFYGLSLAVMSVKICVRNSRQDGKDGSAGELKATDCGASAFSWKNTHLIAALWAASLQMSQDTNERLVQHANKTAVASPTAKHWLAACFLFLQLRPALLHSMPGNRFL